MFKFDINNILGMINVGATLFDTIVKLVDNVKDTLSEDDAAKLEEALADLQKRNDEAFTRVSDKLKAAASR